LPVWNLDEEDGRKYNEISLYAQAYTICMYKVAVLSYLAINMPSESKVWPKNLQAAQGFLRTVRSFFSFAASLLRPASL